jgi:hypothetical protein
VISLADILVVAHSWAYRTGRHAVVIDITRQLNAARGLRPRRVDAVRCDAQFDYDREREGGWAAS